MATLAASGRAYGLLRDVFVAQALNRAAGGAVIAPWHVGDLPEEWLAVVPALQGDYRQAREGMQKIESAKAKYFERIRKH